MFEISWNRCTFNKKPEAKTQFSTRNLGMTGFSNIFDFAVCGGVFCMFAYDRDLFSVIYCHFAHKHRCASKVGFSADNFLRWSSMFFKRIVVYLKLGSRLAFLSTFLFAFLLTFIDQEEEGRKEGRSGSFLKIQRPHTRGWGTHKN